MFICGICDIVFYWSTGIVVYNIQISTSLYLLRKTQPNSRLEQNTANILSECTVSTHSMGCGTSFNNEDERKV